MSRKFIDFVKEAERREQRNGGKLEDYILELEDGSAIAVPAPDAQTYLALGQVKEGDVMAQLRILFDNRSGDFYRLLEELKGKPAGILQVIIQDMQDFWGKKDELNPGKSAK